MKNSSYLKLVLVVSFLVSVFFVGNVASAQYFNQPDVAPPWVMRWTVVNITTTSATINWTTDELSDGRIEFCTTWMNCANFSPIEDGGYKTEHTINLSGLKPGTRYYFWMYSRDQWGNLRVYGYKTFNTVWVATSPLPTLSPTPAPTQTPWPTPFPTQTPVAGPDVMPPWVMSWSVTGITPFSANINWTTDEPADAKIEFCTTWMNCGNFTPTLPAYVTDHAINLSGLNPGTRYYFWMYSRDQWGNLRVYGYKTFTTAWTLPSLSPTPLPTPSPTPTPIGTPYPTQTPVPGPDLSYPWVMRWTVLNITTNSAQVDWITNEPTDGQIEYCLGWMNCGVFTPLDSGYSTYHTAFLNNLVPGKRYYFWMYSRDTAGNLRVYGYKTFNTVWSQ